MRYPTEHRPSFFSSAPSLLRNCNSPEARRAYLLQQRASKLRKAQRRAERWRRARERGARDGEEAAERAAAAAERKREAYEEDDGDDDADDAMETSWPNDDADLPPGAVGGAPPTQDLLNMLQQSIVDGDKNAQGDAMVNVVQRLVNDVNQVRRSVAREARANTRFRLSSQSVSQQREENARQLTANIALDAAVTARTDAVTAGIDERKRREEEERRKKELRP